MVVNILNRIGCSLFHGTGLTGKDEGGGRGI